MTTDTPQLNGSSAAPSVGKLWEHPNPENTEMHRFKTHIAKTFKVKLDSYHDLWQWSVDNVPEFWGEVWSYTGVKASKSHSKVVDAKAPMFPRPAWYSGAELNFAENLLFPKGVNEDDVAVIAATEEQRERVTWKELREKVRLCANALKGKIQPGDRVAGYVGNHTEALVAMLATTSLGGVWSGISPDHGATAVLDRWAQLEPTILFADTAVFYNGRAHDSLSKLREFIGELPSLKHTIIIQKFLPTISADLADIPQASLLADFIASASGDKSPLTFKQLPPDHPVYILFSSGTTGKPKCIVHGAIGTLIQHKKEHFIHCDIGPKSVFFQFTTVTWMMWHWLVSGLASGATVVLYDGSPFRPLIDGSGDLAMPKLIDEFGVTHFGTSAKYLSVLEQNKALPLSKYPLKTLQAIYSTAAPLAPSTFDYVHANFPPLNLASITGGTDILSLFGAPCSLLPVHQGQIQCAGLGMSIIAFSPSGTPTPAGSPGDLVCTKPFPCQPVTFHGPNGEKAYFNSYFATFPGVWHHGDFIVIDPITRGLTMLGRSDGVLKPAGVRFGSAELYNVVLAEFPDIVEEALCVGRRREGKDMDESVLMFLVLKEEWKGKLDEALKKRVKDAVKTRLSIRHVPAVVEECPEIPVTSNGKKVEVVVKGIVCGWEEMRVGASVANRGCLEWFKEWARNN
ncbi:acetoacetate-CoA ligase [Ascodesmis nigricans]|uniref:Acetoacetate-CoA ligase n=1 Tax=Ascodesmis nigricans TaxID=341454 RepID=A0A4S2N652_9PEZI|nr:acetoacetate-CoA ligase [Ascodesmis nigricans]